ncbi:Transposase DDE domain-containing protein [Nitrosomonas halophila]|uniref:Transposase DDE domain-containing protein n=1 Tax=Nitrosomonas halophila TaxID=44576 RepID=A0A1H3P0X0_9PROT|nr:Transposase DDE domain-containing protein [Nitrosomonas halophila]
MSNQTKFSPEVRERSVRLVQEHRGEYPSLWAAVESIAPKIGCVPSTLLEWVKRSFAWLEKNRRLWKNCERLLNTSLQFIHLAFMAMIIRRYKQVLRALVDLSVRFFHFLRRSHHDRFDQAGTASVQHCRFMTERVTDQTEIDTMRPPCR